MWEPGNHFEGRVDMGLNTFAEDHRRLAIIPEQSPPSSTDRGITTKHDCEDCDELVSEDQLDQDIPTCDNEVEQSDSTDSDEEDDFLSSRSRVHVDISQLVNDAEAAAGDDEEECYNRDSSSDVTVPAQGAFGPSPILVRRGRAALALKTAVRGPESEELRHITDFSNDFEQCIMLQGGKLTNRQRRWLGLEEDADLQTLKRFSSPLRGSRNQKFLGSQLGKGFRRRPMWIPLSIMVAGI